MDVRESEKDITVHADLPGVKKDDVFVRAPPLLLIATHKLSCARGVDSRRRGRLALVTAFGRHNRLQVIAPNRIRIMPWLGHNGCMHPARSTGSSRCLGSLAVTPGRHSGIDRVHRCRHRWRYRRTRC